MKKQFRFVRIYAKLFRRLTISFLKRRIDLKTLIILTSLVVGIISGLAAIVLKQLVHFFQQEPRVFFKNNNLEYLTPFTPLIGIILSVVFITFVLNGKITRGLSNLIFLILRKNSDVPRRKLFSHLITSALTVGMGGSAGLEAPIVITGAAIGSNAAKELRFNYQTRALLLACGSAAGISAIFNSPIAGVIFAFEVLLPEFSIPYFIPLLISSASAAVLSNLLYGGQIFFLVTEGWVITAVPFYIILGVLCGVLSLYIIKTTFKIEEISEKIRNPFAKALIGGSLLCALIFFIPPLFGEGYSSVENLLAGRYDKFISGSLLENLTDPHLAFIVFAAVIILTKAIATSLTLSFGGNGGVIAPSLFTGAITGFFVAHLAGYLNIAQLNHPNFIVVGMAGILSGVLHSPLTGIFLIAEITGGYILIVPLMIVTAISFFISRYFHPNSIYTAPLVKRGIKYRSEKEKYFVQQLTLSDLIETDFVAIHPGNTLRILVEKIASSKRNIFPVVDENRKLIGIVTLNDIREFLLNSEAYDIVLVYELMNIHFESIDINTDVSKALEIFEQKNIWNLAVTRGGEYVGFVSKSSIFNRYITIWSRQQSEEI